MKRERKKDGCQRFLLSNGICGLFSFIVLHRFLRWVASDRMIIYNWLWCGLCFILFHFFCYKMKLQCHNLLHLSFIVMIYFIKFSTTVQHILTIKMNTSYGKSFLCFGRIARIYFIEPSWSLYVAFFFLTKLVYLCVQTFPFRLVKLFGEPNFFSPF